MLTLSVGVTFWELTYRMVYCGCCRAGRKIWLWFGSRDEEGNRSTYFIYLFSVILPVHISWVRFFCTLFVRPWKLTAGLHQHSEVLRALTSMSVRRARLLHPSCLVLRFFSPALASHCLPSLSQTGSQELQEWVQTSQRFLKRSSLLNGSLCESSFQTVFSGILVYLGDYHRGWDPSAFLPSPTTKSTKIVTLLLDSFWGKLVWKKGSTALIFNFENYCSVTFALVWASFCSIF